MAKVVVTGGGTGGHVYPGLAVAEVLRREYNVEILWIGSARGLEAKLVRNAGVRFASVPAGKLRRYFSWRNVVDGFSVAAGFFRALTLLRHYGADFLFSKGGYVSVPPVAAAWFLGIPVATHESDLVPGLATRLNAPFCHTVFLPYSETVRRFSPTPGRLPRTVLKTLGLFRKTKERRWSDSDRAAGLSRISSAEPMETMSESSGATKHIQKQFGGDHGCIHRAIRRMPRVVVTGNPVRLDLAAGDPGAGRRRIGADGGVPVVLVLGGSQGAEQINAAVGEVLDDLCRMAAVVHQHGRGKQPAVAVGATRERYMPLEYIGAEYPDLLAAADLVVSRAGAGTIWEIANAGKASILVPLVSGSRGDQVGNAELFARSGAAVVLNDARLGPGRLLEHARRILTDTKLRRRMERAAAGFTHGNAAFTIADYIANLLEDTCPRG